MDILNSALSDEGQQPAQAEPIQQEPEQQEQSQQATGEIEAATPAETQETTQEDTRQKGLEAALLAERRKRQELENLIRQAQQAQQPQKQPDSEAPNPESYQGNEQQYWRDLARYEARQELIQLQRQAQQQAQQHAQNQRVAEIQERLGKVVATGNTKFRDFDAVINGGLAPFLNDAMREELGTSDLGADVAYYLGKNPGEAARIAQLEPRALAREIVRLEQKVATPPRPQIPQTLTQVRDSRGQFAQTGYDGPTPLDAVLSRK